MTGHTQARDWLAAELRRHGLAPAVIRAVLGGADTYAARASASAVAAERERIRQMAQREQAVCTGSEGTQCYFADLLGGEDGHG